MTRRTLVQLALVLVAPLAACSDDHLASPNPLAACGGRATQITLAVGAYTSVDPASDSGCVTFPANSAADSAEYLVVPQSVTGSSGATAAFQLHGTAVGATAILAALASPTPARGFSVATAFDGFLRSLARRRRHPVPPVGPLARAPMAPAQAGAARPPVRGTLLTFPVCG